MFNINFCQWLDLNRGPLELEANALPTEPQPLPPKMILTSTADSDLLKTGFKISFVRLLASRSTFGQLTFPTWSPFWFSIFQFVSYLPSSPMIIWPRIVTPSVKICTGENWCWCRFTCRPMWKLKIVLILFWNNKFTANIFEKFSISMVFAPNQRDL